MDRDVFLARIAPSLYGGPSLRDAVRAGIVTILDRWDHHFPAGDDRWLAYALATAHHETAYTMQPIREIGFGKGRPYGTPDVITGHVYAGRGFVQLTWKANYLRAGYLVGRDLVADPDAALRADVAADILLLGMARGIFTGRKFGNYFNAASEDWYRARRIVNGLDCADRIARYGRAFHAAMAAAG